MHTSDRVNGVCGVICAYMSMLTEHLTILGCFESKAGSGAPKPEHSAG